MGQTKKIRASHGMDKVPVRSRSRKDSMKRNVVGKPLPRLVSAEPVVHGVLKVVWTDGYEGVVDLRPTIARGQIFSYLRKPANFQKVRVTEYGHSIEWIGDKGEEIDFAADTLRVKADNQARLNEVAAVLQY